jgi:hypothetical protein
MSEPEVEYEFVKGQGWVPRLKSTKFKFGDMVKLVEERRGPLAEPAFGAVMDDEYMRARSARRYPYQRRYPDEGRPHDDLPTFEEFRRSVRLDRAHDRRSYTIRYLYRARYSRDTREYAYNYDRDSDMNYALRQLYDSFIQAETQNQERCQRCGREGHLVQGTYGDTMRCNICGWEHHRPRPEPIRWEYPPDDDF